MTDFYGPIRAWIGMVAACAFAGWLAACAQPSVPGGEGTSSPPSQRGIYVFPPADLQVYD
jgi:hypothetical protein